MLTLCSFAAPKIKISLEKPINAVKISIIASDYQNQSYQRKQDTQKKEKKTYGYSPQPKKLFWGNHFRNPDLQWSQSNTLDKGKCVEIFLALSHYLEYQNKTTVTENREGEGLLYLSKMETYQSLEYLICVKTMSSVLL